MPKSSAGVRRVVIHDIKEVEDVGQQEQQDDKREDEEVKRSEATLAVRMKHEDDYGTNGDSNLSHCLRASKQGRQSRTMTLADNKEERLTTKNEGSSMHDGSCIGINYAHTFSKCFRSLHTLLGFSLSTSVNNSIVVAVPIYSISDLYANSL